MDARSAVDVVRAQQSASPDGSLAEPDGSRSAMTGTPSGMRSSPPILGHHLPMDIDPPNGSVDETAGKSDSEAETIVLPGKDGHSPSKIRKSIKHEDKSDKEDEEMRDLEHKSGNENRLDIAVAKSLGGGSGSGSGSGAAPLGKSSNPGEATSTTATSMLGKRKRSKYGIGVGITDDHVGNSSGLSSVPTSPVATTTTRSSLSKLAGSDSEISRSPSPRPRSHSSVRDKAKSVDRVLSRKKRYASGSEGEVDPTRYRRQRSSGTDHKTSRDAVSRPRTDSNHRKRSRSISPHSRSHKRSISTQLPYKTPQGLSHKKKRIPAPLQSTEYHSDESSASGRSHPRSSRVRHLAAPATGDSAMSPAKMYTKKLNPSGQTPLAIAVQKGTLEVVKQRYEEGPSELNMADNAMNTPLHVASLYGYTDIVRFLIRTGDCELDSVNLDKDTPLHDAVDNGHLEVVKLLLDAGANPSKANKAGNEPIDIVNEKSDEDEEDAETWAEMKHAILTAKRALNRDTRRASEDHHNHDSDGRMSHPKGSPRQTSPTQNNDSHNQLHSNRRIGNARQMNKTKDTTLYQRLDLDELREAARDGDASTVSRILEVMPNVNDPQTLYYAAKGGHDAVVNLLFALGDFDPDPPALDGFAPDHATPILAAIGKPNLEIIKLLLVMPRFDPTRGFKGETYSQVAKRRGGPNWQEEERLFKDAQESYKKSHKSTNKPRSPGLRRDGRDAGREVKKSVQKEESTSSRSHQRSTSNPKLRESDTTKTLQRNGSSSTVQGKEGLQSSKRGPGRPKKEETGAVSDSETTPLGPPRHKAQKKSESDIAIASDHEPAKPRRKLVSGKEFRGERELERQRRASVVSNASSASVKENRDRPHQDTKTVKTEGKQSSNVPRTIKHQGASNGNGDRDSASEKHSTERDRARSLKRDDSKDRLTAIRGESPAKRPRKSETPPRSNLQEVYPQKRRKLDSESASSHLTDHTTPSSSPEIRSSVSKSTLSRENTANKTSVEAKGKKPRPVEHLETTKGMHEKSSSERSSKSNNHAPASTSEPATKKPKSVSNERPSKLPDEDQVSSSKAEEEAQRQSKIRREKREAEILRLKEIEAEKEKEAAKKVQEKELSEERQREEARQAREKALEEERLEQLRAVQKARDIAAKEEEEKRQREDAEKKERQRILEAEATQRAMEAQKALYLEQEKIKREEADRRRAQQLEQQRAERARIEKEKREDMLSKLPLLLKWFELDTDPKLPSIAKLFKKITGFRYDTIKPEFTGQPAGREQWMLNYHVAILLGEKDLQLSRYTAWERINLSHDQKRAVWNTENGWMLLANGGLPTLRKQLPLGGMSNAEISAKNQTLFLDLDLFFVKVSEFMYIVPNFPHLRNIELQVDYQELRLPQTSSQLGQPFNLQKWRHDPDLTPGQTWAPLPKHFVNGVETRQEPVSTTALLKDPPPMDRFPRRGGIIRVYPGDFDYEEVCRKQGIPIPVYQASPVSTTTPQFGDQDHHLERVNGITPPRSDRSRSINGGSPPLGPTDSSSNPIIPNGVDEHHSPPSPLV